MHTRSKLLASILAGALLGSGAAGCGVRVKGPVIRTPNGGGQAVPGDQGAPAVPDLKGAPASGVHVDKISGDPTRQDKLNQAEKEEEEKEANR